MTKATEKVKTPVHSAKNATEVSQPQHPRKECNCG